MPRFSYTDVLWVGFGAAVGRYCFGFNMVSGVSMEPTFVPGEVLLTIHPTIFLQSRRAWRAAQDGCGLFPSFVGGNAAGLPPLQPTEEEPEWRWDTTSDGQEEGTRPREKAQPPLMEQLVSWPVTTKVAMHDDEWKNSYSLAAGEQTTIFCKRVTALVGAAYRESKYDGIEQEEENRSAARDAILPDSSSVAVGEGVETQSGEGAPVPTGTPLDEKLVGSGGDELMSGTGSPSSPPEGEGEGELVMDVPVTAEVKAMLAEAEARKAKKAYWVQGTSHLWLRGDNLWNSHDSRNFGPVHPSRVSGVVVAVVWPPSHLRVGHL